MTDQQLYERNILAENLKKYGEARQWDKLVEEMGELIRIIQKIKYDPTVRNRENLLEELVDVEIVLAQVKLMLSPQAHEEAWRGAIEHLAIINPETHA